MQRSLAASQNCNTEPQGAGVDPAIACSDWESYISRDIPFCSELPLPTCGRNFSTERFLYNQYEFYFFQKTEGINYKYVENKPHKVSIDVLKWPVG